MKEKCQQSIIIIKQQGKQPYVDIGETNLMATTKNRISKFRNIIGIRAYYFMFSYS